MSVAEILETMEYGPAPESSAPALEWIARHGPRLPLFIAGEFREPASGQWFDTFNPATGEPLAQAAQAGPDDVDDAVASARSAQPAWWEAGGHTRARYLYAMAREVQKRSRLLAVLETLDNGKPIRETRDIDVPLAARHFYHHAGWAQLMETEVAGFEPVGVAGQIIPWNFPLLMLAWKIAPALAMGNTVALKPAEYTPLTAIAFAEICNDIGLPAGVVNILTGDGSTGELMVRHCGFDKIAFTGSTEVGRIIRAELAGAGRRLSLELGGKSPFIVFDDADLDAAVEGVVDAIWFNQGQVCCAGSRLLVQESVEERFLAKLRARMESLRVGSPLDKAVDIGAIIAPVQLERIRALVETGCAEGACLWQPSWAGSLSGKAPVAGNGRTAGAGWFYPPTLLTNVAPASTVAQIEIFGPVLAAMSFRTPGEAVQLANNSRYGLAASVWTENINLALDVAPKLVAGTVWVNCTNQFDAASGFGGYRESGFGREGGREGLWEYVQEPARASACGQLSRDTAAPQRTAAAAAEALDEPHGWNERGHGEISIASAEVGQDNLHGPRAIEIPSPSPHVPPRIDRTAKLYVGGMQVRPDSGYIRAIHDPAGNLIGEVGEGSRKDIRNAVEAAHTARSWAQQTGHARAQVLYYLAENLEARAEEFAARIARQTDRDRDDCAREVAQAVESAFTWAAWADKNDGAVHHTTRRMVTMAMPEPVGVIGIACPEGSPLVGFTATVLPAVASGNAVVAVPSSAHPLSATDLYQVLDTSDVPGGVINIVTGERRELAAILAAHDDVDAVWYFGEESGPAAARIERAACGNMKRVWLAPDPFPPGVEPSLPAERVFLHHATQVKNIWIPYGVW